MKKKQIIAMLLAGGQGSRLKKLTEKIAKPAVSFGGKYRIIDFTLSNCSNSGIDTVGVLTQYEPHVLNEHIGNGSPWDLDRMNGGVTVLQPHTRKNDEGGWYKGTANAIYQNMQFIDKYSPEHVLILSGDHIYKMDYAKMLKFHIEKDADVTIGVFNVPLKDASSFGIMNTNDDLSIYEFEEKPKNPKSTLASMGIYIFKWEVLKKYLIEDEKDPNSSNDFGKNIIPNLLKDKMKLYAYPFEGYWKDVGTITSFWDAHMDLLKPDNKLQLFDKSWRIYTRQGIYPPLYVSEGSKIVNSLVEKGCEIEGEITNSVIFPGVKIGKNTKVTNSVIMPNTTIEENVIINKAIIDQNVLIEKNTVVGDNEEIVVIGAGETVKSNAIK
ncbi:MULTISPECIES: glucose-1-phosphate adenylyltransferase [Fusobacterium]|jgi:glucose-1-phosphate adenylyltransferase|uniref:Glucose-1-phosphate adenylyltransferase n=1 Tax=Fusobacterium hominis TaxID=2764326 RepID=A0A7G9GWQ0_9FUSO|nr:MULTISPECIES: glucose-1-phosphate adenylyltransferase [Fusobacterium]QNM15232.1 glucose-1-phosphate adenylyltransferase [Fusobacterium hominis]